MKSQNAVVLVIAVLVVSMLGSWFIFGGQGVPGQAIGGDEAEQKATVSKYACPDEDGKIDLLVSYVDGEADTVAGLQTDYRLYEIIDNEEILVQTEDDATSTTYGNYTTYSNALACSKMQEATNNDVLYVVYLGDETEEYYRRTEIRKADLTKDPVRIKATGATAATISLEGYDEGTYESTFNITIGNGETYTDASIKLTANTADDALEAKDGFVFVIGYNDTAWEDPQIKPATQMACPEGADSLVDRDDTVDGTSICWRVSDTYLADYDSRKYDIVVQAESGVNPEGNSGHWIDFCVLDQNYYQNGELNNIMIYGYTDEDNNVIGQSSCTELDLYTT